MWTTSPRRRAPCRVQWVLLACSYMHVVSRYAYGIRMATPCTRGARTHILAWSEWRMLGIILRHSESTSLAPRIYESGRIPASKEERRPVRRMHRGHSSTLHSKEGEETIDYVDFIRLYPWVCKYFIPRRSSNNASGMRGRTCHARKRRTRAVHGAASEGPISSAAALQL